MIKLNATIATNVGFKALQDLNAFVAQNDEAQKAVETYFANKSSAMYDIDIDFQDNFRIKFREEIKAFVSIMKVQAAKSKAVRKEIATKNIVLVKPGNQSRKIFNENKEIVLEKQIVNDDTINKSTQNFLINALVLNIKVNETLDETLSPVLQLNSDTMSELKEKMEDLDICTQCKIYHNKINKIKLYVQNLEDSNIKNDLLNLILF